MPLRHPGFGVTQRDPVAASNSRPLMMPHSWSAAKIFDKSTTLTGLPVETSTSVRNAHRVLPAVQVKAFFRKLPTQRWLPSQASPPAWLTSWSVLRSVPVVEVRKISEVQSQGWEYQRLWPSNATPTGQ